MSSDMHDLLSRMADELDNYRQLITDDRREVHALAAEARAALAAAPVREGPSDEELYDLAELFNGDPVPAMRRALELWGRPATPPTPPEGEVGELVEFLKVEAYSSQCNDYAYLAKEFTRAATLLEQLSAAAPVVVPVAVSERLPGAEDCTAQGWCWVFYRGFAVWSLEPPLGQDGKHTGYTHWLPAHALPLPAPQGGEGEA